MMLSRYVLVGMVVLVAGCATQLSERGAGVQDADDGMVAGCKYVGNVSGTSGVGGVAASTGIQNAKNEARDQAGTLGATHVVWRSVHGGYMPSAVGDAYLCE